MSPFGRGDSTGLTDDGRHPPLLVLPQTSFKTGTEMSEKNYAYFCLLIYNKRLAMICSGKIPILFAQ